MQAATIKANPTVEGLFPQGQYLGIRVLHRPAEPTVDVVLIHGITGHPYKTFVAENGVYWPTQLLAQDISGARVLSFGYDADVAKFLGPVGQNNTREHASTLISDIAALRAEDNSVNAFNPCILPSPTAHEGLTRV